MMIMLFPAPVQARHSPSATLVVFVITNYTVSHPKFKIFKYFLQAFSVKSEQAFPNTKVNITDSAGVTTVLFTENKTLVQQT